MLDSELAKNCPKNTIKSMFNVNLTIYGAKTQCSTGTSGSGY